MASRTVKMGMIGKTLDDMVKSYGEQTKSKTNRAIRMSVIKIWGDIITETPVDTGRARGNWFIDVVAGNETGGASKKKGANYVRKQTAKKDLLNGKLFLYNNLPYIQKLEYGGYSQGKGSTDKTTSKGYSALAPKGMVRKNVLKWRSVFRKAYKAQVK